MYERKQLANKTVTTALTDDNQGEFGDFVGMKSLTVEVNFTYGSGGTNAKVWIQTSLDGGTTWVDIMAFAFTTASVRAIMTVLMASVATPVTPLLQSLTDDTTQNGILGDRLRALITTTGTYAGSTTIKVTVHPKGA